MEEMQMDLYLKPHIKIHLRYMKYLNWKYKTLNIFELNT